MSCDGLQELALAFHELWGYRADTEDAIARLMHEIKREELYFSDFKVGMLGRNLICVGSMESCAGAHPKHPMDERTVAAKFDLFCCFCRGELYAPAAI
jgi:hypothetical protein